jgi:hypothetical protein
MHNYTDMALNRIYAIEWGTEKLEASVYMDLLDEYFRRASQWMQHINCDNDWPFFDIPRYVDSTIRIEKKIVNDMRSYIVKQKGSDYFSLNICEFYLQWVMLNNSISLAKFNLSPPYEPLIVMYEQGAFLCAENGGFGIKGGIIGVKNWRYYIDRPPLQSSLLQKS